MEGYTLFDGHLSWIERGRYSLTREISEGNMWWKSIKSCCISRLRHVGSEIDVLVMSLLAVFIQIVLSNFSLGAIYDTWSENGDVGKMYNLWACRFVVIYKVVLMKIQEMLCFWESTAETRVITAFCLMSRFRREAWRDDHQIDLKPSVLAHLM